MSVSGLAMGESIAWGPAVPLRNALGPAIAEMDLGGAGATCR